MKPQVFGLWVIILTSGMIHAYSVFRNHFSGLEELKIRVVQMNENIQREKLKTQIAHYEAESFREHVATLFKPDSPEMKTYSTRNIASLSQVGAGEELNIEPASSLFQNGRKLFNQKQYQKSNEIFTQITKNYPYSVHVIESYFLLAEGLYQVRESERCLEVVDDMVGLFPENDLTGFSLLRVATILRERERLEDAVEVYRTIIRSFQNRDLVIQAKTSLSEIEI